MGRNRTLFLGLVAVILVVMALFVPASAQDIPADPPGEFRVRLLGENEKPRLARDGPFKIIGLDDNQALRAHLEEVAGAARARIFEQTRVDWEGTALIVWEDDERRFLEVTGQHPENTAAAADAARHTVWVNARVWRSGDPSANARVMTHELGHLMVGNLPGGKRRLPLWFEEGLVQHLAGEWDILRAGLVARSHLFGQVPRLEELSSNFPQDPEARSLAYAISYVAVGEVASTYGDEPGTVERLMRRLADKDAGPRMNADLWDATRALGYQGLLEDSLGSRATSLLIWLSSGTALWVLAVALTIWGGIRKRRLRLIREAAEAREESWAESLTDDDIQDVWGDREERFDEIEESPWECHQREEGDEGEGWKQG